MIALSAERKEIPGLRITIERALEPGPQIFAIRLEIHEASAQWLSLEDGSSIGHVFVSARSLKVPPRLFASNVSFTTAV